MLLGPNLTKTTLNLDRSIVDEWLQGARRKSSLWKRKERLPNLLVVLEEWTCPTWVHLEWSAKELDPGPTAVGLVTRGDNATPAWLYLSIPEESITISRKIGNTAVSVSLISLLT